MKKTKKSLKDFQKNAIQQFAKKSVKGGTDIINSDILDGIIDSDILDG